MAYFKSFKSFTEIDISKFIEIKNILIEHDLKSLTFYKSKIFYVRTNGLFFEENYYNRKIKFNCDNCDVSKKIKRMCDKKSENYCFLRMTVSFGMHVKLKNYLKKNVQLANYNVMRDYFRVGY